MRATTSSLALAGLLSAAAFGLIGCGDGGSDGGGDTTTPAAEKQQEEPAASGPEQVAKDTEITACEITGAGYGMTATLVITNSADEPKAYHGTLNFLDTSGKVVAEGLFHSGDLEPGKSSTEEVPAQNLDGYQGALTCEVGDDAEISDPK